MISPCPPYYSSALSCLLHSHHVLLFKLVASDCLSVRPSLVALSSLLLSLSLSPCRSHPVFIFCLAILLAFCLLFSAMRQLLSDIEKLGCSCHTRAPKPKIGCGCHTRAPKPISVSCVCRGAEARSKIYQHCSGPTIARSVPILLRRGLIHRNLALAQTLNLECEIQVYWWVYHSKRNWKNSFSYYRKRGSASYIVREVHSVRERERERYRERKTEVTSPLSR